MAKMATIPCLSFCQKVESIFLTVESVLALDLFRSIECGKSGILPVLSLSLEGFTVSALAFLEICKYHLNKLG